MKSEPRQVQTLYIFLFFSICLVGLFYVKWMPYWHRGTLAASTHSIGSSILMGGAASPPKASWQAAISYGLAYGKAIWQAMVLGLLLGSGVQALLPGKWILRHLGKANFGSVAWGALLAIPGMMCTCCAAPVVAGLRRVHASAGAAVAFWLGNSVLNPATLVFIVFVLGWHWAMLRLFFGLIAVIGLGFIANRFSSRNDQADIEREMVDLAGDLPVSEPFRRWMDILGRMILRLLPEYVVLVLLLGAARVWLFPHAGPDIDNSLLWIIAFAIAGTLFVIPTAGEVPIIQAMLALGVGAGPAGALLLVLPPISVPSLALVSRSFEARTLVAVSIGIVATGIAAGLAAVALGL